MKKIIGLLLLVTCLFGCRQKDDVLTEINDDGTGGISCLVNGEILVPEKRKWLSSSRSPKKLDIYFHKEDTTTNLGIDFYNGGTMVWMNIHDIKYQTYGNISLAGTIFQLGENDRRLGTTYGEYSESWGGDSYYTTEVINGELEVTFHDVDNYIMSGTFWFDAINDEGKIVEIRDGRFDMKIE